jgi:transcription-repair coupling factor (superfamily II helicase)
VAELKGEPIPEPAEIKLEVPVDASLPVSYVEREDLRLEAYRRLAAVTSAEEVEDIRTEWEDRYGPVPQDAQALLEVARLRAHCVRTGVTDVTVTKGPGFGGPKFVARISPLSLRTSATIRLDRLYKGSVYKAEPQQLQLHLSSASNIVDDLVAALTDLVPVDEA